MIEHFQLKFDIFTVIKICSILHRRVIVNVHVHSNVYIAFEDVLDQSPMSYHAFDNPLTITTLIKQVLL